jgi:hypothetical protein
MRLQDAKIVAESTLRATAYKDLLDRVEIVENVHVDGEPQFEISAFLKPEAPSNMGWDFVRAQLALIDAFEERGEARFPLLRTRRPNDLWPEEFGIRAGTKAS